MGNDSSQLSSSSVRRRVVQLQSRVCGLEAAMIRVGKLLRRLARAVCRKRRAPTPSRTLTKTETDHFRRRMAEHGMDDHTPDPKTKREEMQ